MGDRRSSFPFRFWSFATPASRRSPAIQPTPTATTSSAPTPTRRNPTIRTTTNPPTTTTTSAPTTPLTNNQSAANTATTPQKVGEQTPATRPDTVPRTNAPAGEVPTSNQSTTGNSARVTGEPEPRISSPPRETTQTSSSSKPEDEGIKVDAKTIAPTATEPKREPEPKTKSPARAITLSPPSSKPASPSHRAAQYRSPPQPSSPSRAVPQVRSTASTPSRTNSRTPSKPQKAASLPHSPSRLASNSPKQISSTSTKSTQPTSPSKESNRATREISNSYESPSLASKENGPKAAESQQEPLEHQSKAHAKSNGAADGINVQTSYPSATNHAHKLNEKADETKEVKEVIHVANAEANKEIPKEANDFGAPKSGSGAQTIDRAEVPSKLEQEHRDKQEGLVSKEILPISLPHVKPGSQPKGRGVIPDTRKRSAVNGENAPLNKDIRDDVSTFLNKMSIGGPKSNTYDRPVSVITLAGENRGASMQIGSNSSKGEGPVHIRRGYKANPDESPEATTDGEGSSKGKRSEDAKATENQPTEAYVNNNAQGINNSIVFNSSVNERSPGVRMVLTRIQKELNEPTHKARTPEARKAEYNMTRADKLTYEPTVRRRCLRGLFLESSDSDQEKPRRHGCRVGCKERGKETDTDVLGP